jgi:hypothetical protein
MQTGLTVRMQRVSLAPIATEAAQLPWLMGAPAKSIALVRP